MGCTRNGLSCNWPSGKPNGDNQRVVLSILSHTSRLKNLSPFVKTELTPLIDPELQSSLVKYTMNFYLPIQVHQYPGVDQIDQSHLISMSFHSPALMDILLANAARTLDLYPTCWRSFEIESYIRAVRAVREILREGGLKCREDSLLATLMWLCIYEVREILVTRFSILLTC